MIVIQAARNALFFSKASSAYSEHVGVNRQACGKSGDRYSLYRRMTAIIKRFTVWCLPNARCGVPFVRERFQRFLLSVHIRQWKARAAPRKQDHTPSNTL